ncbi:MAG: DUF2842 domain-containing protein [Sphingomonadales bacterium]|nr:DUF2842 domain-containing protein [Sphingomonadales bacterium]MBK8273479.1 DUF2842 domain-containing protein [Sphingomonadales bacterium]MBK9588827.1 DUF2842 domain-containing protein [Sphingomonadales bacterium]MBL0000095.1 DUF2842 domain-containing protein [Sphingomonadales bacterium]
MEPSWRKPAGMIAILGIIAAVAVLVGSFSAEIARLPALLQGMVYIVCGIVWIAPLKPLLSWMETGRFRRPPGQP